jgi:hypothetical protein
MTPATCPPTFFPDSNDIGETVVTFCSNFQQFDRK